MIQRYLKLVNSAVTSNGVRTDKPYLRALVGLDRRALEDIGVSLQEVEVFSPSTTVWKNDVIASGLSSRWSLSGDWERSINKTI